MAHSALLNSCLAWPSWKILLSAHTITTQRSDCVKDTKWMKFKELLGEKNHIFVVAPGNNQNCLFDSLKEAWMEYVLRDNSTDLSKCQRRFFTKVWRKCMIGIFHFLGILFLRCQPMHFPCIFCRIVCLRIYQLTLYNFGCYKKNLRPV